MHPPGLVLFRRRRSSEILQELCVSLLRAEIQRNDLRIRFPSPSHLFLGYRRRTCLYCSDLMRRESIRDAHRGRRRRCLSSFVALRIRGPPPIFIYFSMAGSWEPRLAFFQLPDLAEGEHFFGP